MTRTALIDADIVAYRVAAKADYEGDDEQDAVDRTINMVRQWTQGAQADSIICCLSPTMSFRHGLWVHYKAHRKDKPRPTWLESCRKAIRDTFPVAPHHETLEADDVIGILMTNGRVPNPVCVTIDKDLKQVPGEHWDPIKEVAATVSDEQAEETFLYQWVAGDSSDGYPGIPKFGPVKAQPLVEADDPYGAIIAKYIERGLTYDYALTMARLAKIITAPLWDAKNHEVILWTPQNMYA